jgi:hypothetical protein
MTRNHRITRPTDACLEGDAIVISARVIAEVTRGELRLADREGRLRPARPADIRLAPDLTDIERHRLRSELIRQRRGGSDHFEPTLIVPLPPMCEFRSCTRLSPIAKFQAWVDAQAGEWTHPSDVMIARENLDELLNEQREWLRVRHDLRGERLARAVGYSDLGGGPLSAPRGRSVAPGWALIRSTKRRREGGEG